MTKPSQQLLAVGGSAIVLLVIITAFVGFSSPQNKSGQPEKIFIPSALAGRAQNNAQDYIKISDVRPNWADYFYYPDTTKTQGRDVYQKFLLIRLPEEMGGAKNDTSAFRAYSALDLESHCLMKYWPQEGRRHIEDPCHVGLYRPQDGLMIISNPLLVGQFAGLPYLDLSSDSDGYLYVEPPTWTMEKNGVVGIGRTVSAEYYRKAGLEGLASLEAKHPERLDLPVILSDGAFLTPGRDDGQFYYKNQDDITRIYWLEIKYCGCHTAALSEYPGVERWVMGADDVNLVVRGTQEVGKKSYSFGILRGGYQITFETFDTRDRAMAIFIDSFFPGKNYSMLQKVT